MVDVCYLVPGVGLPDDEKQRRERVANELTPDHVDVTVLEAEGPGPTSIESAVEEYWCVVGSMKTAHRVQSEFDALVIGCFGDPGIRALRELLSIPVVGPAEATIHTASMVADRFTWLTILEATAPMSHEQAHEHHLADRCVSVRSVDAPVESIDHGDDDLVERMVSEGKAAVEEDGAEALFPGCMSLSFAQRHDEIEERVGVPFLDPASIALEQAAAWARHGVAQSPKTYPEPKFEKLGDLLGEPAAVADDD
ncbi:aspartate/glutamate racemase family protein [Halorubrum sp. SD683]|uniref:aspartate/glutamate racemase family protein n=1 Tax=Halorubrum sp. SD683 TaxID=1855873 RepID=UPI000A2E3802|nr:aspartate/glutamate racemase family protein [Halorubrum sp. SD683]OTF01944.1 Asp/Glu racemase [Halorubrum sp. SD683]